MRIFARLNRKQIMNKPLKRNILFLAAVVFSSMVFSTCREKPQTFAEKIDQLKQQIVADSTALHQLEYTEFQKLVKDFMASDSALQYLKPEQVEAVFEPLNLTQAYLQQFSEVSPDMHRKMRYSLLQLDRLKADAQSGHITDSLALEYLETETQVADTLHHRVLYFQDRFAYCSKEMAAIKKIRP